MAREIFAHFTQTSRSFHSKDGRDNYFDSTIGPYEYLLGALSGCWYSTLTDVIKDGITYDWCDIHVEGVKREESPTTLKHTRLTVTVKNPSDFDVFRKACEATCGYCSIFQTIAKVSEMELVVCQAE